ncbi:DNA polymerase III subunit gamma/tau [Sodalinema gerasimenkoae]|uniref:DNA polymerase III subunit gamma/tau n=1 Tax=Sodalinema gerasimenkoae TaxID=2862348 RepID=UPI00135CE73F|nr:DNA polymerase III subunit gamma/tau [Sodalinema gerasimenkoae]
MVYEPLHHKYRPATFADLVGQSAIASTLTNAIRQERIAPAYLFCGPRGTGKTSSARIFAKSLNCLTSDRPTATPCGTCDACRSIARGSALDVIEIDAASNTGVDNIRELIERAQFAPVQARYKVYIIDECHMLSTAAFNSLLKTLEEPPAHVIFILATTDPQRVLPTIISRCQRFDYRRIALDAMTGHLRYIAEEEAIAITDDALTLIAQLAQGGLRDAESVLDQLSLLPEEIDVERVWDLVGAVPERDLLTLLEAIAQNNPQQVLEQCRYLLDRGREPPIVMQNLAAFYRDLLIAKTAPHRNDLVTVTAQTWEALCQFAQQWDERLILAGSQHLRACDSQVRHTTQPRLWLEVTLLGLLPANLQPPQTPPSNAPLTPSQAVSTPMASVAPVAPAPAPQAPVQPAIPPTPAPQAPVQPAITPSPAARTHSPAPQTSSQEPAPSPSPPPPDPAPEATGSHNLPQVWQQVLENIEFRATRELLRQQGRLLSFDGQTAQIGVPKALIKMAETKVTDIEAAFQNTLHKTIRVKIGPAQGQVGGSSPPTSHPQALPPSPNGTASAPSVAVVTPSPPTDASFGSSEPARGTTTVETPPWEESASVSPPEPQTAPIESNGHSQSPGTVAAEAVQGAEDPLGSQNQTQLGSMAAATDPQDAEGSWEVDKLHQVAQQFAQFFNGHVVDLDDDLDFEL